MAKAATRILLIEDERDYARLVQKLLSETLPDKSEVEWVRTLAQALKHVAKNRFDAAVVDLGLPDSGGVDTVARLHDAAPDLPIVVLSGVDDEATVQEAVVRGAQEYLVKEPSINILLGRSLRYAMERKKAEKALRRSEDQLYDLLENANDLIQSVDADGKFVYVNRKWLDTLGYSREEIRDLALVDILRKDQIPHCMELFKSVCAGEALDAVDTVFVAKDGREIVVQGSANAQIRDGVLVATRGIFRDVTAREQSEMRLNQAFEKLEKVLDGTVDALATTVELRDPYTAGHERKASRIACAMARRMGFPEDRIKGIHVAGVLHDIGKIAVPAEILSKPGPLTDIEYSIIKTHPQVGHDALESVDFPWPVAQAVLQHHEKMDGSGYPQGLREEKITHEARILCVADVVDAMSSHRPYRAALGLDRALEEISESSGVFYDAEAVVACIGAFREDGLDPEQGG